VPLQWGVRLVLQQFRWGPMHVLRSVLDQYLRQQLLRWNFSVDYYVALMVPIAIGAAYAQSFSP
jgi:hypothetical protein